VEIVTYSEKMEKNTGGGKLSTRSSRFEKQLVAAFKGMNGSRKDTEFRNIQETLG